jgi:predicted ATP-grasp superfamily ATP-dependent carboligase
VKVLITDGNERAALAVTRALGGEQVEVIVGAESQRSLAGSSRYCRQSISYPSPYQEPERFIATLMEAVRTHRVDALIPLSDIAMHVLGPEKAQFEKYTHFPAPSPQAFQEISDKYRLMQQAITEGVAIPDTIFVPDGRVERVVQEIVDFPVVVKPGCSLVKEGNRWTKTSVSYAESLEELLSLYRDKPYLRQPSLIQRRVIGEGQGLFVLMQEGTPLGCLLTGECVNDPPPAESAYCARVLPCRNPWLRLP